MLAALLASCGTARNRVAAFLDIGSQDDPRNNGAVVVKFKFLGQLLRRACQRTVFDRCLRIFAYVNA